MARFKTVRPLAAPRRDPRIYRRAAVGFLAAVVAALFGALFLPLPVDTTGWTAYAPLQDGHPASAAIDGDVKTSWISAGSQSEEGSIQVNLGSPQSFSEVTLDSSQGGGWNPYTSFEVQVSTDGSPATFRTIGEGPCLDSHLVTRFAPARYQFLRVRFRPTKGAARSTPWAIAELRVYQPGFERLQALFHREKFTPTPQRSSDRSELMAWWKMDEGQGATVADSSGHHVDLAVNGGGCLWTRGVRGNAILFWGGGSYLETSLPVLDTTGSYTVMAWVKLKTTTGYNTFVSQDGQDISAFYLQFRDDTKQFALSENPRDQGVGVGPIAGSGFTPETETWYHLAGVYDAEKAQIRLYVNGKLTGATPFTTPWPSNGVLAVGRGKWQGRKVDFVNAALDEVRAYRGVVKDEEIARIYRETRPGKGS